MHRPRPLLVAAALAAALVAGCGSAGSAPGGAAATDAAGSRAGAGPGPTAGAARPGARRRAAPRCAPGAANCAAASGRIIALESVDPDGDGDLHLVLAGRSITLPGITVLDVSRDLRPRRDPRVGDWAAGVGPVYRGSHDQRQIQVERLVVRRR